MAILKFGSDYYQGLLISHYYSSSVRLMEMSYGQRLAFARKRARLTQKELQQVSGVPQQTISKIERGDQSESSYDSILAFHLGCSAYWLSTGKGDYLAGVLSEDEQLIIQAYRAAPEKLQKAYEFFAESQTPLK